MPAIGLCATVWEVGGELRKSEVETLGPLGVQTRGRSDPSEKAEGVLTSINCLL